MTTEHPYEELVSALGDACDVAIWLSALVKTEGEEWAYWENDARPRLHKAINVLLARSENMTLAEWIKEGAHVAADGITQRGPAPTVRVWTDDEIKLIESCSGLYHATHRYCPECPWTEEYPGV